MNYAALKTEILTDPNGYGYAPYVASGDDSNLARLLNEVRVAIQIDRETVEGCEVLDAIQAADLAALDQLKATFLSIITSASGGVKVKSAAVRAVLGTLFAGKTTTLQALLALQTRAGSRAEQLVGSSVSEVDIAIARRA